MLFQDSGAATEQKKVSQVIPWFPKKCDIIDLVFRKGGRVHHMNKSILVFLGWYFRGTYQLSPSLGGGSFSKRHLRHDHDLGIKSHPHIHWQSTVKQNPYDIPLYWLVNKEPSIGLLLLLQYYPHLIGYIKQPTRILHTALITVGFVKLPGFFSGSRRNDGWFGDSGILINGESPLSGCFLKRWYPQNTQNDHF